MNTTGPTPAEIFETLNAHQQSSALRGAIELDLFSAIAMGNTTSDAIARHCGTNPRATRILCDFLTVRGFLSKSGGKYSLSQGTAMFLVKSSPHYMGTVAKFMHTPHLLQAFSDVAALVRRGSTLISERGTTETEYEGWVEFARSMAPVMRPAAQYMAEIATEFCKPAARILDIAAGHGIFGITIAQGLAESTVVALDWAPVLKVAQENASKANLGDRFKMIAGDAFKVDFGGEYDLVLLTNILHHFDRATCVKLLKKVSGALRPGGTVLTLEFVPNEDRVTPPISAAFAMMMLGTTPAGDAYTLKEYESMFAEVGLTRHEMRDVPNSPNRLVISRK